MGKIVVLLLVFALFHTGSTIKCYNCESSTGADCTDHSKLTSLECKPLNQRDATTPVCIRKILKSAAGTNITLQCVQKSTGNECDPPTPNYEVAFCTMCREDLCNGDSRITASLVAIFGSTLFYLASRFNNI